MRSRRRYQEDGFSTIHGQNRRAPLNTGKIVARETGVTNVNCLCTLANSTCVHQYFILSCNSI